MVINDKVRNKVWTERIDSKLDTKSWENQALAILKYFFPVVFADLYSSDAPDIQDRRMVWGIEVVRVGSEEESRLLGEIYQYYNGKEDHDETKAEKYKVKILRDGGSFTNEGGVEVPLTSSSIEKSEFKDAMLKKLAKLPEYKEKGFAHMGLFMIHNITPLQFLEPKEIREWLDSVQEDSPNKYDRVFVLDWDNDKQLNRLVTMDFESGELEIKHIPASIMMDCVRYGRLAAEGGISSDEPIWI